MDIPSLGREANVRKDLRAIVEARRLIARERPAIVHTHTSKAGFVGRLAARLAGVPAIIHQPHGHIFRSSTSSAPPSCVRGDRLRAPTWTLVAADLRAGRWWASRRE